MYLTNDPKMLKVIEEINEFDNYKCSTPFEFLEKLFKNHLDVSDHDLAEMLSFELKISWFDWHKIIKEFRRQSEPIDPRDVLGLYNPFRI